MHVIQAVSASTKYIEFIHRPNYISTMKRQQAFKFALRISASQARQLYGIAGSCRYVYNRGLALQKSRHENGEKKLTYVGLCKELT
jgi:putative transposase